MLAYAMALISCFLATPLLCLLLAPIYLLTTIPITTLMNSIFSRLNIYEDDEVKASVMAANFITGLMFGFMVRIIQVGIIFLVMKYYKESPSRYLAVLFLFTTIFQWKSSDEDGWELGHGFGLLLGVWLMFDLFGKH